MSQSITSASQCATWSSARSIACAMPSRAHVADGDDQIAGLDRVLVHRAAVGEAGEPDLRDVRARQAVLDQRAHRIAVAQALARVSRMSKWASSVISPTSSSAPPSPSTAGRVTALLPPTSRVSACASALAAHRVADERRRLLDAQPGELDVAAVGDLRLQARARSRHRSGRSASASRAAAPAQVARARRHRTRGQRRAEQPDRRVAVGASTIRSERLGQPAHRFDASSRARLRRRPCGTGCSSTATSRRWRRAPGNPLGRDREWRDRHRRRQDRPRRQAHRACRLPRQGGRRARRRLGDARA